MFAGLVHGSTKGEIHNALYSTTLCCSLIFKCDRVTAFRQSMNSIYSHSQFLFLNEIDLHFTIIKIVRLKYYTEYSIDNIYVSH